VWPVHGLHFSSICLAGVGALTVPPETLNRLRYLHGRAVSYSDAWLAAILASLTARGMLKDTLVIVTSDHGESFGEGGLISHGFCVAQQLIHIPLVAAGPGAELFGSGIFSLASLPSVIATAAGIADHGFASGVEGIAVSRYGAIGRPEDPSIINFAEQWSLSDDQVVRLTTGERSATDGRLKLVVSDTGRRTLTDLATGVELDPGVATGAALTTALASAPVHVAGTLPAPGGAPSGDMTDEEIAALEQQMRLLGYM
jgi:arylsulfatase A-like enzyme